MILGSGDVSAPALWGKLPSHADYLQHGVRSGEVTGWQDWLARQGAGGASARSIPVAFVLPAGALPFALQQPVMGVIAVSADRLGREHPMIVYQRTSERWLAQALTAGAAHGETRMAQQTWLFWLARLVALYVGKPGDTTGATQALAFDAAVARLWAVFAPHWTQRLGLRRPMPPAGQLQAMLTAVAPTPEHDAAAALHGVNHMPWADWPQRLFGPQGRPAFWQQDAQGGYVGATQRLTQLWERRP